MVSVAEIVTSTRNPEMDPSAFANAARATEEIVKAQPGFVMRHFSEGPDGSWTDFIVWQDMEAARTAAKTVVKHPMFAPFGAMISGEHLAMRHEDIRAVFG